MIRKNNELITEARENMRGGDGTVKITNYAGKDDMHGKARLFAEILLEPGCGIGAHTHEGESEFFYIRSGKAVYNDNGTEREVAAGDVTVCAPGESHSIRNPYDEPAVVTALIVLA